MFKVHYSLYQHEIHCDEPIELEMSKIQWIAQELPAREQNFLGFTDSVGTILQFYVDSDQRISVDIPAPQERGSYGKHVDHAEFQLILDKIAEPFAAYKDGLQLIFEPW